MKFENFKRFKKPLSVVVVLITGFFILGVFFNNWQDILNGFHYFSKSAIVFSGLFYLCYFYLRSIAWLLSLKAFDQNLSFKDGLQTWFYGESARYLPGNVWSFASKVYFLSKKKIPKSVAAVSLILEVTFLVVSAFLVSTPTIKNIILKRGDNPLLLALFVIPIFILLYLFMVLVVRVLGKDLPGVLKKNFNFNLLLVAFLLHLVAWLCYGIANFNLVLGVAGSPDPKLLISIPVFAWLIGYLSFVTPTGLGVREGALILLASPYLGTSEAGLLAILSRATLVLTEGLNLLVWLLATSSKKGRIIKWVRFPLSSFSEKTLKL